MPDVSAALRALRLEFLRSSRERLVRIEDSLARLRGAPSDAGALDRLRREFHGFSGLGGTYGFPNVSELGHRGEMRCAAFFDSAPAARPAAADLAEWREVLEGLRRELDLPPGGRACRILAVSGDPDRATAIQRALEMAGYAARVVASAAEAESGGGEFAADLVVLDGGEKKFEAPAIFPAPPVVTLPRAGPFDAGALLAAVAAALEGARADEPRLEEAR